jgi:hypothetical protein
LVIVHFKKKFGVTSGIRDSFSAFVSLNDSWGFSFGILPRDIRRAWPMTIAFGRLVWMRMKPRNYLLMVIVWWTRPNDWAKPIAAPWGNSDDLQLSRILIPNNPPTLLLLGTPCCSPGNVRRVWIGFVPGFLKFRVYERIFEDIV